MSTRKLPPVLLMATPSHESLRTSYCQFLSQHWSAGVGVWPAAPNCLAAVIVFCHNGDFKNGQATLLRSLVDQHVPILVIDTNSQGNRLWSDLSQRNRLVKYTVVEGKAWYDTCFHFLGSLQNSLRTGGPVLLATSIKERQQKHPPASG